MPSSLSCFFFSISGISLHCKFQSNSMVSVLSCWALTPLRKKGGVLTLYSWCVLLHMGVGVGTSHHILCTSSSCSPIPYKGERGPLDGELGTRTMHCRQALSSFLSPVELAGTPNVSQKQPPRGVQQLSTLSLPSGMGLSESKVWNQEAHFAVHQSHVL